MCILKLQMCIYRRVFDVWFAPVFPKIHIWRDFFVKKVAADDSGMIYCSKILSKENSPLIILMARFCLQKTRQMTMMTIIIIGGGGGGCESKRMNRGRWPDELLLYTTITIHLKSPDYNARGLQTRQRNSSELPAKNHCRLWILPSSCGWQHSVSCAAYLP